MITRRYVIAHSTPPLAFIIAFTHFHKFFAPSTTGFREVHGHNGRTTEDFTARKPFSSSLPPFTAKRPKRASLLKTKMHVLAWKLYKNFCKMQETLHNKSLEAAALSHSTTFRLQKDDVLVTQPEMSKHP